MELSLFLAKVIGLYLVIVALLLLFNKRGVRYLFDIYQNPEAVFLTGVVELFLGLALVVSHNTWTWNFQVIITVVGWTLLVRGLGRVAFPERTVRMLERFKTQKALMTILLIVVGVIGAYLAYMGFTA